MNRFDLFLLRRAGLTNRQLLKVLAYQKQVSKKLPLRDIAVVSGCKDPVAFMERYKALDNVTCRQVFQQFPSFSINDGCYPDRLKEIYNPPVLLFYQGNLDLLTEPALAVVGARSAGPDGIRAVEKIVSELDNRFTIISGLAKGIDSAAHKAAIRSGASTIGVVGCGLDRVYPVGNERLQAYMAKEHLVISEYEAKTEPKKHHFPDRNRIIAGLSQDVIVAQAKTRSGSLITCERAMEEGRDVFAIPESILDGQSDGCHHLIQEGAKCITSGQDILCEYV